MREQFGDNEADQLLPKLRRLLTEFYDCDAYRFTRDPDEAGEMASGSFEARHPEIHQSAVAALSRLYVQDLA